MLCLAVHSGFGPIQAAAQPSGPEARESPAAAWLTNVQQVLKLGTYRARNTSQPVQLRGIIVQLTRKPGYVFLQDQTACILVTVTNVPAEAAPGKLAEVEGWTEAGLYAPLVDRAALRIIGEASLPQPMHLPVARMRAGEGCWQWVRVEGVVRDMNRDIPNLALSIAAENQRFTAFVFGYDQFKVRGLPLDWLEARVSVEGICWTDVNDRNQPMDFHLAMMHTNQIRFLRKGTTNLFGQGGLPGADPARLHQPSDDRLKLTGTVLATLEGSLFLRTEFGPVQARLSSLISRGMPTTELVPRAPPEPLEPGDRIELVGAPSESHFAPLLVDAEYRRSPLHVVPTPVWPSRRELINGRRDAELVRIVGRLLAQQRRQGSVGGLEALVLETGGAVFEADWLSDLTNALPAWPLNARLEITGICRAQPAPAALQGGFKVLLRSPADVRYLGQTHFWSQPGAGRMLGIAAALVVAGGLWVLLLRRQVGERTSALATANRNLVHEVEERKKAQAELKRALAAERELSELKSRFVSLVSHEFRTPLGITMSAVELLRNYLDRLPPQKLKELLEDIYSSTLRMSGLMEQVLFLGRVEAGKLMARRTPIDLGAITDKLVAETLSANSSKCPIHLTVDSSLDGVEGDENLLRHILLNLLSNAVKYSPEGQPIEFLVQPDDGCVVFTVRDHGIGIPESDQARLFDAFHRASNVGQTQGTGLGLLIVKRCVELLEGQVTFQSRQGAGTTFTVRLPWLAEA